MKRVIFFTLLCWIGMATTALAQTGSHRKVAKQHAVKTKSHPQATAKKQTQTEKAQDAVSLTSTSTNEAYSSNRLAISDPTINVLNMRASGNNVPISSSGIVGMPKGTYGFARGKILLRSTTAPSSGTSYGSGAVGTGTTISGVGAGESVIGVNGKNPYAGSWLWGSRIASQQPLQSSTTRKH